MPILVQVLLALAPYLVPPLIAGLTLLVTSAISKLPANSRPLVQSVVASAVSATEQLASSQLNSAGKRQLADEFIQKQLAHYGLSVPESVTNAMVEEAVLALNAVKDVKAEAVVALPLAPGK